MEPAIGALLVILGVIALIVIASRPKSSVPDVPVDMKVSQAEPSSSEAPIEDPFASVACGSCRQILLQRFSPSGYAKELDAWRRRARGTHAFGRFERTYAGMRRQYPNAAELFIYQEMVHEVERRNSKIPHVDRIPCNECAPPRTGRPVR